MTLARDASSGFITRTPASANSQTYTTNSFTPPGGAIIVVWLSGNQGVVNTWTQSCTDSLGSHLTWTLITASPGTTYGINCVAFVAYVGASSPGAMTVSITAGGASNKDHAIIGQEVITGANTSAPIGAKTAWSTSATSPLTQSIIPQATGSFLYGIQADWSGGGNIGAGTGCFEAAPFQDSPTYEGGMIWVGTSGGPTATASTSSTNISSTSTAASPELGMFAFEILDGGGGTAVGYGVPMAPPPPALIAVPPIVGPPPLRELLFRLHESASPPIQAVPTVFPILNPIRRTPVPIIPQRSAMKQRAHSPSVAPSFLGPASKPSVRQELPTQPGRSVFRWFPWIVPPAPPGSVYGPDVKQRSPIAPQKSRVRQVFHLPPLAPRGSVFSPDIKQRPPVVPQRSRVRQVLHLPPPAPLGSVFKPNKKQQLPVQPKRSPIRFFWPWVSYVSTYKHSQQQPLPVIRRALTRFTPYFTPPPPSVAAPTGLSTKQRLPTVPQRSRVRQVLHLPPLAPRGSVFVPEIKQRAPVAPQRSRVRQVFHLPPLARPGSVAYKHSQQQPPVQPRRSPVRFFWPWISYVPVYKHPQQQPPVVSQRSRVRQILHSPPLARAGSIIGKRVQQQPPVVPQRGRGRVGIFKPPFVPAPPGSIIWRRVQPQPPVVPQRSRVRQLLSLPPPAPRGSVWSKRFRQRPPVTPQRALPRPVLLVPVAPKMFVYRTVIRAAPPVPRVGKKSLPLRSVAVAVPTLPIFRRVAAVPQVQAQRSSPVRVLGTKVFVLVTRLQPRPASSQIRAQKTFPVRMLGVRVLVPITRPQPRPVSPQAKRGLVSRVFKSKPVIPTRRVQQRERPTVQRSRTRPILFQPGAIPFSQIEGLAKALSSVLGFVIATPPGPLIEYVEVVPPAPIDVVQISDVTTTYTVSTPPPPIITTQATSPFVINILVTPPPTIDIEEVEE